MKRDSYKLFGIMLVILLVTTVIYFVGNANPIMDCQWVAARIKNSLPKDTQQLIVVESKGTIKARVTTCEWSQNKWRTALKEFSAVVGQSGVAKFGEKQEGDKKTPSGVYPVGEAFGSIPISLRMDYKYITKEDKFIDDPKHPNYNAWVTGRTDAKSFETMLIPQYKLGLVINYNMNPVISGAGSAIFMHIWTSPSTGTFGCVAASEESMQTLLQWLDKNKRPYIYIIDKGNAA